MTMITPSYLGETIEYSSLHACRSTLEDPTMEYKDDPLTGPYYPAVAQIARELVERSINGLDPLVLRQRLLRDKIEEAFCMSFGDRTYALIH